MYFFAIGWMLSVTSVGTGLGSSGHRKARKRNVESSLRPAAVLIMSE